MNAEEYLVQLHSDLASKTKMLEYKNFCLEKEAEIAKSLIRSFIECVELDKTDENDEVIYIHQGSLPSVLLKSSDPTTFKKLRDLAEWWGFLKVTGKKEE